ncbi:PAS domain-containing protein [Rhodobacter maris]|uniref:PAS domain S-box-containing protein/diguanylate cyclase (GGDEF)-like protein n=1 Tax=Rhodobacter maris TaxID=446682 RepID=A0A285RKP9_9RHOB|nr:PAS domain-containing protein [Rhodobacter maris]SOB94670.1 PAS domain S-box-containing protein/diguanylate cyclase (GGDEF)-like protein [Rhodobacter maris]
MTIELVSAQLARGASLPANPLPAPAEPPAAGFAFDGDGLLIAADPALCARLGHASETLRQQPMSALLAEADRAAVQDWLASEATEATLALPATAGTLSLSANALLLVLLRLGPGLPGRGLLVEHPPVKASAAPIRGSQDPLAALIESADLGLWQWNVQTGETLLSERWAEVLGYQLSDLDPIDVERWAGLWHPEDLVRARAELARHFAGESEWYEIEARLRHKSGRWVWVRDLGRVRSWTADGRPEWMSGIHRNIDAWKRRESRLLQSQDLLERAGMLAGLGGWEVDLRSGELFWSDETCRIHGVPPGYSPTMEEAIAFYAPEAQPLIRAAVTRGIENGMPWDIELPILRPDGERVWVRAVGEAAFEDGRPVRLNGAFQNISDRKETEHQLAEAATVAQRSRDRLNTLADNAPGALFEHRESPSGAIDLPYFSARLPELMGVSREEILADGAAAAKNIHPEDAEALGRAIAQSRTQMRPLEVRYRLNHPRRGLRWMQLTSVPYHAPDGSVTWHGSVFDVTEESETVEALRIAHERLNTIAENVPGALFEYRREADGRAWFPYFTQKMPDLLGIAPEDLGADPDRTFAHVPPEDRQKIVERFTASRESLTLVEFRTRVCPDAGEQRWLHVWAAPFARPDGTITWFGKAVDISDRVAVEAQAQAAAEEVRLAHARLNSITDIAPVGLFEFRLYPDGRTEYPYASARYKELLGVGHLEFNGLGTAMVDRVVPEDRARMHALTLESARNLTPWRMRFRFLHPKRGLIWLSAASQPVRQNDGTIVWTGGLHDVTADVARETELERAYGLAERMRARNEHLALHDGLTGLPNRRYFDRRLEDRMQAARAGTLARDCALIQIDIDHFKHINDTLGHEAGDRALCRVAEVLRGCLDAEDFAARLGGDEFSVLLAPGRTRAQAETIAAQMRAALREPFHYRGTQSRISASFGIVCVPDVTGLTEELQISVDAALYRAKAAGRDRIEVVSGNLTRRLHDSRTLVMDLQEAIEADVFEPWFLPQICARTGALGGIEAQLRWRHPKRGLLAPRVFLPLAEQLQILPELERILVEKSEAVLAGLTARGLFVPKIGFDLCTDHLPHAEFLKHWRGRDFGATQVAVQLRGALRLDAAAGQTGSHLRALKESGIAIEIAGFGTGPTALVELTELRPAALKIAPALVARLHGNPGSRALLRAVIDLAAALGCTTIAEGVETEALAETLRELGCNLLQGAGCAAPIDAAQLADFLAQRTPPAALRAEPCDDRPAC